MTYKLVECPRCRHLFITTAERHTKCIYCNHSFKLNSYNVLFESEDVHEVQRAKATAHEKAGDRPSLMKYFKD